MVCGKCEKKLTKVRPALPTRRTPVPPLAPLLLARRQPGRLAPLLSAPHAPIPARPPAGRLPRQVEGGCQQHAGERRAQGEREQAAVQEEQVRRCAGRRWAAMGGRPAQGAQGAAFAQLARDPAGSSPRLALRRFQPYSKATGESKCKLCKSKLHQVGRAAGLGLFGEPPGAAACPAACPATRHGPLRPCICRLSQRAALPSPPPPNPPNPPQEGIYCHNCAYSKGLCAMCGKQVGARGAAQQPSASGRAGPREPGHARRAAPRR
jgi:hypothetical protein